MSYDFSFDKKSVFFILGGSLAIGVLLFFAGFVVGWDRGEYSARLEMQNGDGSKTAQKQPVSDNQKTLASAVAPPAQTNPAADPPDPPAAQEKQEASAAPASQDKASPSTPEAKEEKQEKPGTASPRPEQTAAQAAPEKAAAPQPASSADDPAGSLPDPGTFSLQIGAFQDEHNAMRFKNDLKTRGYPAFVFHTLDAGGRVWHTVRVGHYPDMQKASDAATVFSGKEKIPVYVRPGNQL